MRYIWGFSILLIGFIFWYVKGWLFLYKHRERSFDFAWLLHQKRNKHHWQWWILPEDNGGIKVLEMPSKYRNEMICDWKGASKAQGHGGQIIEWWDKNNHKMQLHPETRAIIERYTIHLERLLSKIKSALGPFL